MKFWGGTSNARFTFLESSGRTSVKKRKTSVQRCSRSIQRTGSQHLKHLPTNGFKCRLAIFNQVLTQTFRKKSFLTRWDTTRKKITIFRVQNRQKIKVHLCRNTWTLLTWWLQVQSWTRRRCSTISRDSMLKAISSALFRRPCLSLGSIRIHKQALTLGFKSCLVDSCLRRRLALVSSWTTSLEEAALQKSRQ